VKQNNLPKAAVLAAVAKDAKQYDSKWERKGQIPVGSVFRDRIEIRDVVVGSEIGARRALIPGKRWSSITHHRTMFRHADMLVVAPTENHFACL